VAADGRVAVCDAREQAWVLRCSVGDQLRPPAVVCTWNDSYEIVTTYQVELFKSRSSSVVEYDTEENQGNICFTRFFVALKP
jgi:hypothetical protein